MRKLICTKEKIAVVLGESEDVSAGMKECASSGAREAFCAQAVEDFKPFHKESFVFLPLSQNGVGLFSQKGAHKRASRRVWQVSLPFLWCEGVLPLQ